MFTNEINIVAEAALKKKKFLETSKVRYLMAAALAGVYVGLGMLLTCVIGGTLPPGVYPVTKLINAAAFSVALSLVVMAGAELFTGNNFVMAVGALEKKVSWQDSIRIWIFAYIGNLIGSLLLVAVFAATGLINEGIQDFVLTAAAGKMSLTVIELITRGILCNLLVCIAVWCSLKMKSESGKLIIIFWCIFTFVACGFEHSVANMTILSLSLLLPHDAAVTLGGLGYNLVFVTIGNVLGGAIFTGAAYWYISEKKIKD